MKTKVKVIDKTTRYSSLVPYEKGDEGYIDGYVISDKNIIYALVVIMEKKDLDTSSKPTTISKPKYIVAIPLGDLEVTGKY